MYTKTAPSQFISVLLALPLLIWLGSSRALAADVDTGETGTGLYAEAGVSLYVIDLPEYLPLWNRIGLQKGDRLATFDEPVTAPMTQISLGWRNSTGIFVEARGRFAESNPVEKGEYSPHGDYTRVGYFPVSGSDSGFGGAGTTGTAYTRTELHFRQLGGELIAGTHWDAAGAGLTLFAGYWGMKLDQEYSLDYRSSTGDVMSLSDNVEAAYNGVLVGVRLERRAGPMKLTLETTQGVGAVSAKYDSRMNSQALGGKNSITQTKHDIAYRGTLEGTVSANVWNGLDIGLKCGLQYLSYVPQVRGSGQGWSAKEPSYGPAGPAHIKGKPSVAGSLGLNLAYSF
jgi:hypothetical protein